MGVAGSSSISWTTFLRSQSPGFCDAFSSEKGFQRFSRAEFSILPGGRGRSAAAGAAVRRRRGPTAAGRRIRGLRRCRGRRVVRCSALRSWSRSSRSLPRSSVVARRRARDELATMAAAPAAAAAAAAAVSRHRDGAGSGVARPPRPAGGVRGNSVARDLSQRYVCLAIALRRKRAPHAAPASAMAAAAAAATSPRAPPAGRAAPARGGPSGAGAFAPARGPARAAARNFCARHRATPPLRAPAGRR